MKTIVLGILAHVDAGKTTLTEAMLYTAGAIRKLGRVDKSNAFLDTYELERSRGITIFSKQARMEFEGTRITLVDTPGHVDFSAEMERTLQILDYAVLVISGSDGVQAHTVTLWRLLSQYRIPVFLFINKMDQPGTDKGAVLSELQRKLTDACLDFSEAGTECFKETAAMCDEEALDEYLETGVLGKEQICRLIKSRKLFPCFFGAALRLDGVKELLEGICKYGQVKACGDQFGARVYKIARDEQGNRLTYMKLTGGSLKVKDVLTNQRADGRPAKEPWEEKVNQIRLYSGERFETAGEIKAGEICAVTGLTKTYPGLGLGTQQGITEPLLEPVFHYKLKLPEGCDPAVMLPKLKLLEEEEPELHVEWDGNLSEIHVRLMGEVQIEVFKHLIEERFQVEVELGQGAIVYKETIKNTVEGVGHFEPLRHYAEVHLLLEPGEPGSGIVLDTVCSEDGLDRNWQRLILTHLEEKTHKGVLTGSAITDMKITLVAGRAHNKHTEGGDFRQATYRALRQGLMEADSVLLEPWYEFILEIPNQSIGKVIADLEQMGGSFFISRSEGEFSCLTGCAPVVTMRGYQKELTAYTKGAGRMFCTLKGYEPCHNEEEVIKECGYDPERDTENPAGSVFCSHGAGLVVSWDKVKEYMHVESPVSLKREEGKEKEVIRTRQSEEWLGTDEIDAILERTFYANRKNKGGSGNGYSSKRRKEEWSGPVTVKATKEERKQEYLLVDGYNMIFAWKELKELAETNLDGARGRLLDMLCNYQAMGRFEVIVVFDAYRIEGHKTEIYEYHNIHVVFTKEAETADQYIERFAHENRKKYDVSVATSDGLEQIIIRGQGCRLISAKELWEDMERLNEGLREEYLEKPELKRNRLFDGASHEILEAIADIQAGE